LTIGWTLAILFLTLTPGDGQPGWFDSIPHFDKAVHFGLFFLLSILACRGWQDSKWHARKVNIAIIFIGIVLATVIEILQSYIPFRSADIFDWWADFLGIVFGVWLAGRTNNRSICKNLN